MSLLVTLLLAHVVVSQSRVGYRVRVDGLGITVGPGNGLSPGGTGTDTAFLTTQDGKVFRIQESTGVVLNQYSPGVTGVCATVVDWNDASYSSKDIGAYAVGNTIIILGSDGAEFDSFTIYEGEVTSQPIVHSDLVYVVSNSDTDGFVSIYDPFGTNPSLKLFFRQQWSGTLIGPVAKGEHGVYYGTNNGMVFVIETASRFDPVSNIFASVGGDMRGRPVVDASSLVMLSPGGTVYGWGVVEGSQGSPLFQVDLGSDSAGGSQIAPVKSGTSETSYVVSGSSTFAVSGAGSILWTSAGEVKTKPVLEVGGTVITVEQSGEIKKEFASNGALGSSFTPSCGGGSCGTATGYAMLSEDKSLVITIHDTGWLVAVCADCVIAQKTTSPTGAPLGTKSPISFAPVVPVPITEAPTKTASIAPVTASPVTLAPVSAAPVTLSPTTAEPTGALTTAAPTKKATAAPTTAAPTREEPSTAPVRGTPSPVSSLESASGASSMSQMWLSVVVTMAAALVSTWE